MRAEGTDASLGLLNNVPIGILQKLELNALGADDVVQVIILYTDTAESTLQFIKSLGGEFIDLDYHFGIVYIKTDQIENLAKSTLIQYIELPKQLVDSDYETNNVTCVNSAVKNYSLSGKGVIVGFVDSGIDYTNKAFINTDGTTRIEYIYDLSDQRKVYNKADIQSAIESNDPFSKVPSSDNTGHGTFVAGIASGDGGTNPNNMGAAPQSSIIMVKAARGEWFLSSQIMLGIKFILDKSRELSMPVVINISLSTNDGAHNGSSLLEQYIRTISSLSSVTIVIAAGNEGNAAHHTNGELKKNERQYFNVADAESTVSVNIYKPVLPDITIRFQAPCGEESQNIVIKEGYFSGTLGDNRYDIYVAGPKPFELDSEIKIIITPVQRDYISKGVWVIIIDTLNDYFGNYSMWLPISETVNKNTKFLNPTTSDTLGIPATVDNVIAVAAYDRITQDIAPFSGRGRDVLDNILLRPDIAAPGVDISSVSLSGGFDKKSGTSLSAPQISGICALMTEWGVVKGNDPYLFGQRLKYYLIKGAKRVRTDITYPNNIWGYGLACLNDSLLIASRVVSFLDQRN